MADLDVVVGTTLRAVVGHRTMGLAITLGDTTSSQARCLRRIGTLRGKGHGNLHLPVLLDSEEVCHLRRLSITPLAGARQVIIVRITAITHIRDTPRINAGVTMVMGRGVDEGTKLDKFSALLTIVSLEGGIFFFFDIQSDYEESMDALFLDYILYELVARQCYNSCCSSFINCLAMLRRLMR
jgi:hypothetical protein